MLGTRKTGWLTWTSGVRVGRVIYEFDAYTKRGAEKSAIAFFNSRPELEEDDEDDASLVAFTELGE